MVTYAAGLTCSRASSRQRFRSKPVNGLVLDHWNNLVIIPTGSWQGQKYCIYNNVINIFHLALIHTLYQVPPLLMWTCPKTVRLRQTDFVIQDPGVSLWQLFSQDTEATCWPNGSRLMYNRINTTSRGCHVLVTLWATSPDRANRGASRETQSQDYKQTSSQNRKFVRVCIQEEKAGPFPECPGNHHHCCHRQPGSEKEVGWGLVLCPLDALQVDAILNHLPQRTARQKDYYNHI